MTETAEVELTDVARRLDAGLRDLPGLLIMDTPDLPSLRRAVDDLLTGLVLFDPGAAADLRGTARLRAEVLEATVAVATTPLDRPVATPVAGRGRSSVGRLAPGGRLPLSTYADAVVAAVIARAHPALHRLSALRVPMCLFPADPGTPLFAQKLSATALAAAGRGAWTAVDQVMDLPLSLSDRSGSEPPPPTALLDLLVQLLRLPPPADADRWAAALTAALSARDAWLETHPAGALAKTVPLDIVAVACVAADAGIASPPTPRLPGALLAYAGVIR